MKRLNIALMAGGDSSEREIALLSAAQIEAALDKSKYDVTLVDVQGPDWHHTAPDGTRYPVDKSDFSITVGGVRTRFDYALIIIHGTPGEDGKLQGYLEIMKVPFSSCSMVSSAITFDKITTKRTVAGSGIRTAHDLLVGRGERVDPAEVVARLGLPLFVKPNASGSSCGVSKVKRQQDILPALERAFAESDEALIEEFVEGREMACGLMVACGREYLFPVAEIIPKKEFFDYEAKYTPGCSDEIAPADIPPHLAARLQSAALKAYRLCRCRGLVRVDFILPPDGEPCLIEVNSIPGMSAGSIVPKQIRAAGMSVGEVLDILIADTKGR